MKLDEMKLLEAAEPSPQVKKYVSRIVRKIKEDLKSYMTNKEQLEVEQLTPFSCRFTIEFNHFMHREDIEWMHKDIIDAIKRADEEGDMFSYDDEGSTGSEYVAAVLSGLRPDSKVNPRAFFPTVVYTVKWKEVIRKKK